MSSLVSIIVPIFNVEKYIEKCLDSIVRQTYKNIEIILVNDGSEENEEAHIIKYMERDKRIVYIKKEKNEGLFAARLTGVKVASGDYIQFIDSDDYISFDFIRLLVQKAEEDCSDMVFSRTAICTPKGSESTYIFQDTELYKLPLEGNDLKKSFYSQHGSAYIWHTIWNKMYSRSLWDKALPVFEKMQGKLVMTEDISFSSILFYYANKASVARNATYFYCKHAEASTNSLGISIDQFERQIKDVCKSFDFVEAFFESKEEWIKNYVKEYRAYYSRMWRRIAENVSISDRETALNICNELNIKDFKDKTSQDDNYFCSIETTFNCDLDELKEQLYYSNESVISFDLFDTLVTRPLYRPEDLFYFLDQIYEKLYKSGASFHDIRIHGEEGARRVICDSDKEDISLIDIYEYISNMYKIPIDICFSIMEYEKKLEIDFSRRRESVYELFQIALLAKKRIIITSDMYLPEDTIITLLEKNGYIGYDKIFISSTYKKLKRTGSLYKIILDELDIQNDEIIHIGDSQKSDIEAAKEMGIKALYVPKTLDVFCGKTSSRGNTHRSQMGKKVSGEYLGKKGFEEGIAYGSLQMLTANRFFDNPFAGINELTDFNMDSYFAGYYVLGTCIISQIEWLWKIVKEKSLKKVYFTSRDGKLLMDAFQIYLEKNHISFPYEYLYVSRRSMLPWMLKSSSDFLELPIVYSKYSPEKIIDLLSFCVADYSDKMKETVEKNGFIYNRDFYTIDEYHGFMSFFLDKMYSEEKHLFAKEKVSSYFSGIGDNDGIFDLGYSAAIHRAICEASNASPIALFMHADLDKHYKNARCGHFLIANMEDEIPNISGLMRELFFSDCGGSCLGYTYTDTDKIIPILEDEEKDYTDVFPVLMFQKGALQLVDDFYTTFNNYIDIIKIREKELLMPFESFLVSPTPLDMKMFSASYFEDKVYGRIDRINVRDFWLQLLMGQGNYLKNDITKYFDELLKKNNKKYLALFGTGKMCADILAEYPDIKVDLFFDNNPAKSDTLFNGVRVVTPDSYPDLKETFIVVAIVAYKEIEEQLRDLGLIKYEDYINYLEIF